MSASLLNPEFFKKVQVYQERLDSEESEDPQTQTASLLLGEINRLKSDQMRTAYLCAHMKTKLPVIAKQHKESLCQSMLYEHDLESLFDFALLEDHPTLRLMQ